MTVVRINALTVPRARHDEFARRFATSSEQAPDVPGLEGFDVLVPDDDRDVCLVVTRWRSPEDFVAWTQSPDFAARHARHHEGGSIETGSEIWSFAVVG